ncbi:MAG: c-type cytochrome [Deinococcales bacterium]
MKSFLGCFVLMLAWVSCYVALAQTTISVNQPSSERMISAQPRRDPAELLSESQKEHTHLLAGAQLYREKCAVCHGDFAGGLAEARLVFPFEEQGCENCHKPRNAKRWKDMLVTDNNSFSIGIAPPLIGESALAGLRNPSSLYSYIKSTMPRYAPSTLEDESYQKLAIFLLAINQEFCTDELALQACSFTP